MWQTAKVAEGKFRIGIRKGGHQQPLLRHARKALRKGGLLFFIPPSMPEAVCLPTERNEAAFFYQVRPALEILHIFPVIRVYGKQPFYTVIFAFRPQELLPASPACSHRTIGIREKSICHA